MRGPYPGSRRSVQDTRSRLGPTAWTGLAIGVGALLLLFTLRFLIGGNLLPAPWTMAPTPETVAAIPPEEGAEPSDEARHASFVSFVLDDVQATWHEVFERHDLVYRDASLVLYRGSVASPCGVAPAASGPFYCHADGNVYLDLASYDRDRAHHGAAVDLGETYAIAREIGHHVQHLIGTLDEARIVPMVQPHEANGYAVALELQAACFAGVWAASADARGVVAFDDDAVGLVAGDDDEEGVDRDRVPPRDASTQASSEQRWVWFRTGLLSGDPASCDTFSTR